MADNKKTPSKGTGKAKKGGAGVAAAAGAAAVVAGGVAATGLLTDDKPDGFADVAAAGGSPLVAAGSEGRTAESSGSGASRGQSQSATREASGAGDPSETGASAESPPSRGATSGGPTEDRSLAPDFFDSGGRSASTAGGGDEVGEEGTGLLETSVPEIIEDITTIETVSEGGARANLGLDGLDLGANVDLGFDSSLVDAGLKADTDLVVTGDQLDVGADFGAGADMPLVAGANARFGAGVEADEDGASGRIGGGFDLSGTGVSGDARVGLDTADGALVVSTELGGEQRLGLIPGVVGVGLGVDSSSVFGQQSDGDFVVQVGSGTEIDVGIPGGPAAETRLGYDVGGEVGEDGGSVGGGVDFGFGHLGGTAGVGGGNTGVSFTVGGLNEGAQVTVEINDETVEDVAEDAEEFVEDVGEGAEDFGQAAGDAFGL